MKVLIVCSGNAPEGQHFDLKIHQAFIYEQVETVKKFGLEFDYFLIRKKGLSGYLKHYRLLMETLDSNNYDIIHAHNGLSGFISNIQNMVPVVTTYHGSDINLFFLRILSYFPILRSSHNIFVSGEQVKKVLFKRKSSVIPCGVDMNIFYPLPVEDFENSAIHSKQKKILFSSSFSIPIKNYQLALAAVSNLGDNNIELIELVNKSREDVCKLMNKSDLLLLTSFSEGSPMVIKEAMACNCPIVSTDVGDVRFVIDNTKGCYICTNNPSDVAEKIQMALEFSRIYGRTNGRQRILELGLDLDSIAKKINEVYSKVLGKKDISPITNH